MNNKQQQIFLILFLITVIPIIVVYFEHSIVEFIAHEKSVIQGKETKAIKQLGEGVLFAAIGIGYIIFTIWILIQPTNAKIPYIVILVGTVAIIYLWLFRIYGIPIPGTDIVITDLTSDWRDVISKALQTILIIPTSLLLWENWERNSNNNNSNTQNKKNK